MTDALNFSDFLNKTDGRRTFTFGVPGVGNIQMHELTALESQQCFKESNELESDDLSGALECIAKWVCWMIKGSKPTAQEVKSVQANYSREVLLSIRDYGLQYAGEIESGKEQLEKN